MRRKRSIRETKDSARASSMRRAAVDMRAETHAPRSVPLDCPRRRRLMRDLNHDFKELCRHNRDGSYATQADREHILDLDRRSAARDGLPADCAPTA